MGFYHTSANVKMMKNILWDFNSKEDISPYEYMETYIEKYPEETDLAKLQWIVETFLGIQKHWEFLKRVSAHMSNELSIEEQDYFMIYFHATTFQISPTDVNSLYKSMFNLNKNVLHLFAQFLAQNESLTFISQVSEPLYDVAYVTDKIISPLFEWQPYVSEMEHNYEEYVNKVESRKIRVPTVPISPNVLMRKNKEQIPLPTVMVPPPNSIQLSRKMLSKTVIDKRISYAHSNNKEKAARLLNEIKTKNPHFAQGKTENYYKQLSTIKEELDQYFQPIPKPKKYIEKSVMPINDTITSIKRLNKRMQLTEEEEVKWLQNVLISCRNTFKVDQLEEFYRQEKERERLIDVERKHLLGQISYEEALLAKKTVIEENKKKYEEFLKEKEYWCLKIERWKELEVEKNRKHVEELSLQELATIKAKTDLSLKKKDDAKKIKDESELLLAKMVKDKREELERKANMIRDIKILSEIAKKSKVPKIIDLTETPGLGLMCEMSIAELQERLNYLKMTFKEEIETKKKRIIEEHCAAKKELENTKQSIQHYITERKELRKVNKERQMKIKPVRETTSSKELSDLKNILEEKRKQRLKLYNN